MHARQGMQQGSTGKTGNQGSCRGGSAFPFSFSSLVDVATSNHLQLTPAAHTPSIPAQRKPEPEPRELLLSGYCPPHAHDTPPLRPPPFPLQHSYPTFSIPPPNPISLCIHCFNNRQLLSLTQAPHHSHLSVPSLCICTVPASSLPTTSPSAARSSAPLLPAAPKTKQEGKKKTSLPKGVQDVKSRPPQPKTHPPGILPRRVFGTWTAQESLVNGHPTFPAQHT